MSKILVPDYFENFHCKCGSCRHPCCDGWGINVDEHEYFSLIGLACSARLRHKIDDAFVVERDASPEAFASIRPNYLEQCPMLDDDGLCLLQKEKGETVMPLICRVYPRAVKKYGRHHEICMSCSCEATVELLMKDKAPLSLHEADVALPFDGLEVYENDEEKDRVRHSVIAVMSNSSVPIVERLGVIGNFVCAAPLSAEGTRGEALVLLKKKLEVLCRGSKSIRVIGEKVLEYLDTDDPCEMLARFDSAERHLYELIPDVETYAGRIISNHMLYESFPYTPDCGAPNNAFAAFCTAVALLKLLSACGLYDCKKENAATGFVDVLAFANRFIEHSDYYKVCSHLSCPDGMDVYAKFAPLLRRAER